MPRFPFRGPGAGPGWWEVTSTVLPSLLMLAMIALLLWAVLRVTSRGVGPALLAGGPPMSPRRDQALDELRLRYARGELTREEFVVRSRDLGIDVPDRGPAPSEGEPG